MLNEKIDVLLLDGNCGLCNRLAMFIERNLDLRNNIKFQSIDSGYSQELIKTFPKNQQNQDTVYLYRKQKSYTRSSAAIRCLLYLKWYWKLLFPIFWIVPLPIRDFFYSIIAKYRHRLFSKPKVCPFRID